MADVATVDELIVRVQMFARERALLCLAVAQFKRRLGGEVSDSELAADKKIANKAATAFCNLLGGAEGFDWVNWNEVWDDLKSDSMKDAELRSEAATLIWDQWLPNMAAECEFEAKRLYDLYRGKKIRKLSRYLEVCGKNLLRIQRTLENDLSRPRTTP